MYETCSSVSYVPAEGLHCWWFISTVAKYLIYTGSFSKKLSSRNRYLIPNIAIS